MESQDGSFIVGEVPGSPIIGVIFFILQNEPFVNRCPSIEFVVATDGKIPMPILVARCCPVGKDNGRTLKLGLFGLGNAKFAQAYANGGGLSETAGKPQHGEEKEAEFFSCANHVPIKTDN